MSTIPALRTSTSRLGEALKHVRSVEAHPPHHAHFDIPEGADTPLSPDTPVFGEKSQSRDEEGSLIVPTREKVPLGALRATGPSQSRSGRLSEESGPGLPPVVDIEHVPCDDDPREWSSRKKHLVLAMMTIAVVSCCDASL